MADWHAPPMTSADPVRWADFLELSALAADDHEATLADLVEIEQRDAGPSSTNDGVTDDSESEALIEAALMECETRATAARALCFTYPFCVDHRGSLRYVQNAAGANIPYLFLLLATALNMKSDRRHSDLDATVLFETFCRAALASYLRLPPQKVWIFGTATSGSFQHKIRQLCKRLGGALRPTNMEVSIARKAKDDGLDLYAAIPFGDSLGGELIVFSQCKTGTSWSADLGKLQPEVFCRSWLDPPPALTPVRAFMVADRFDAHDRAFRIARLTCQAGLFFDRIRLLGCLTPRSRALGRDLKAWTTAACAAHGLRL